MRTAIAFLTALALTGVAATCAVAADDTKVKAATKQVETGAKKIGAGDIGDGVTEMAKGIGQTVEQGAKYTGEKLKEAGQSAKPEAKTAGNSFKDGVDSFGTSVKNFFTRLFGSK